MFFNTTSNFNPVTFPELSLLLNSCIRSPRMKNRSWSFCTSLAGNIVKNSTLLYTKTVGAQMQCTTAGAIFQLGLLLMYFCTYSCMLLLFKVRHEQAATRKESSLVKGNPRPLLICCASDILTSHQNRVAQRLETSCWILCFGLKVVIQTMGPNHISWTLTKLMINTLHSLK